MSELETNDDEPYGTYAPRRHRRVLHSQIVRFPASDETTAESYARIKRELDEAVERETCYRFASVEHARKLVRIADNETPERQDDQLCPVCFVNGRIGGARSTDRQCGLCDAVIMSGSTDVDVLCKPCAKSNFLCRRCGADIDLKNRRKPRPFETGRSGS